MLLGSHTSNLTITKDEYIPTLFTVNMVVSNVGAADILINGHLIPSGVSHELENGNFISLDKEVFLKFVGNGVKKANVSYGKVRKLTCDEIKQL